MTADDTSDHLKTEVNKSESELAESLLLETAE